MGNNFSVVSIDLGNGFAKGYTTNRDGVLVRPNIIGRASEFTGDELTGGGNIHKLSRYLCKEIDKELFVWGADIYKSQNPLDSYTTEKRYQRSVYKLLCNFMLAELSEDENEIIVVTGVPSKEKGTTYEEDLKHVFRGTHVVSVDGYEKIIKVKEVLVLPQPVGTIIYLYLDDDGKVRDPKIAEEYIGVIDIGSGTTDLDGVQDLQIVEGDRATIQNGVHDVYGKISDWINHNYPEANSTAKKVEQQLNIKEIDDSYQVSKRQSIDITEIKKEAFQQFAEDITNAIELNWRRRSKFDRILLSGGGAAIKEISDFFKQWEQDIEIVEDNQVANVIGFYRFGVLMNNREETV